MIRNVIFDMGNVLLDWNPKRIVAQCPWDGAKQRACLAALFEHPDWYAWDAGEFSEAQVWSRLRKRLPLSDDDIALLREKTFSSLLPKHDTLSLLPELQSASIQLFLLSNASAELFSHLETQFNFWDYFCGIVVSGRVKLAKPQTAIYHYLLEKYHILPNESVFIDDSLENIKAADKLGVHTIHFTPDIKAREALCEFVPNLA